MNQTIGGWPQVAFNITLASGDVLTVDMGANTAVVVRSGQTIGTSVLSTWVPGGQWFNLQPGANNLQYFSNGASDTGTMVVQYAPAYIGI
jgi:methionine aminopeptidase